MAKMSKAKSEIEKRINNPKIHIDGRKFFYVEGFHMVNAAKELSCGKFQDNSKVIRRVAWDAKTSEIIYQGIVWLN